MFARTVARRIAGALAAALTIALFVACATGKKPEVKEVDVTPDGGPVKDSPRPIDAKDDRKPKKAELPDLTKKAFVSPSGEVQVEILSTSIGKTTDKSFGFVDKSKEDRFLVKVLITNLTKTRRLDFIGWSSGLRFDYSGASLEDEHENTYKLVTFRPTSRIEGATASATIDPGKNVADLVVFEKPLDISTRLILTLPMKVTQDQKGEIKGTVPREFSR